MSSRLDWWLASLMYFQEGVVERIQRVGATETELEALTKCRELLRLNFRLAKARSRGSGGRYSGKGFDLLVQEAAKDAGKTLPGYPDVPLILFSGRLWSAVEKRIAAKLDKAE